MDDIEIEYSTEITDEDSGVTNDSGDGGGRAYRARPTEAYARAVEADNQTWLQTFWGHGRRFMELNPTGMVGEMIEFWGGLTTFNREAPTITYDENGEEIITLSPFQNQGDQAANQRLIQKSQLLGANIMGAGMIASALEIMLAVFILALPIGIILYFRRNQRFVQKPKKRKARK